MTKENNQSDSLCRLLSHGTRKHSEHLRNGFTNSSTDRLAVSAQRANHTLELLNEALAIINEFHHDVPGHIADPLMESDNV
jgi:hypothetical protein